MADVIFTSGTVQKNGVYAMMINAFIAAGWTNISSHAVTDFDVLRSPGEAGDKNLIIQIRPGNATNVNPITTTDYNVMSYRLIGDYTPGAPGVAGTTTRAAEAWTLMYIVPTATTVPQATTMTYFMNVNKNRMIIVLETPPAISQLPVMHYIGLPDQTYASEPASRGLLVASSAYPKTNATLHITNTPGEVASETASSTRTLYCELAPKNPNSAGMFAFSEIMYGSSTEGFRGKLNGIYALPSGGVNNGDIVNVGTKVFRIVVNQAVASQNSFSTSVFAIQTT